jgi:predicted nucleic-acid-binding Zn-ribbon protein
MSTQMSKDVGCPKCGSAVRTEMWPGVCAQEHPELRGRILDETFFDWTCPSCGYSAQFEYPCLYHDRERGFMVYLAPTGSGQEFKPVDVSEKYPHLSGITKRVVASAAEMKEKILIFESGLNDYAVELVKLGLSDILEQKEGSKALCAYFCGADEAANRICFAFASEGTSGFTLRKTSMDAYRKSLEIAETLRRDEENLFVPVDSLTARDMLDEYLAEEA